MTITILSKEEYLVDGIQVDNLFDRLYCIFDLEGTGILVEHESITQFGAVLFQKGRVLDTFTSLVKSFKPIPEAVEQLTGISNESLVDAPTYAEVYRRFVDFCGDAVLVTQAGYEYDIPMLKKHCLLHDVPYVERTVIDTKALFAAIHPELDEVFSTDYLVDYYGINDADIKRHDAVGDCVLISRILMNVLEEYRLKQCSEFDLTEGLKVKRFIIPQMYLT
ncbi:PolC-type DNA polymerase III [Paenibacillus sp. CF384]|uniref:3'-5' exonuclease n=1 Tax=Paenibacillus sp. CF384 TaxID=1884382 RepID=UPI000897D24E|nr:3'-5' exonuclease [Paenibacillus sp. CF384]SDW17669.1 DNA polymerase-3 subunit epsilon/DNA polymerase-3 subunit alpha [Paenibacillus sp. CF384]